MKIITTIYCGIMMVVSCSLRAQMLPADPALSPGFIKVRVLVYSGVPDPYFVIADSGVVGKLFDGIASLPTNPGLSAQTDCVAPATLGYRGFLIQNYSNQHSEIAAILVYGPKVEIWRVQQAATDGAQVPPPKDFRLDNSNAPTETLLVQFAKTSGVLNDRLVRMLDARQR